MRILVIDDDETFLVKMEKILSLEDHSVVTASSGERALTIIDEDKCDLILMDLKMPGLSGIDLIRKIREKGSTAIIIVITGYGTIESAVQMTRAGAYDYILKPFDLSLLKLKIEQAEEELKLRASINLPESLEISDSGKFLNTGNVHDYNSPYLIISDEDPQKFINHYEITEAIPLWLTHEDSSNAIAPTKLYILKSHVEEFVMENEKGTIILKGIEELLKIHEWDEFKRFLIYLQSEIISSNFSLILLVEEKQNGDKSYQSVLHDAFSILINPTFHNIIELLSHPLRKKIISLLKVEENLNFNKIVKKLDIDRSSVLAFHINKLVQEKILEKGENYYKLSSRGLYIAELIVLLEKIGFSDPGSQVKIYNFQRNF